MFGLLLAASFCSRALVGVIRFSREKCSKYVTSTTIHVKHTLNFIRHRLMVSRGNPVIKCVYPMSQLPINQISSKLVELFLRGSKKLINYKLSCSYWYSRIGY